jgi:hypothetical protein
LLIDIVTRVTAGDTHGYFTLAGTYPERVIVRDNVTVNFELLPNVFYLVIQSNDSASPPLFGRFNLTVTLVDLNEAPQWTSRECRRSLPGRVSEPRLLSLGV